MGLPLLFIIEISKPFFHLGGLELVIFRIKSLNVVHCAPQDYSFLLLLTCTKGQLIS